MLLRQFYISCKSCVFWPVLCDSSRDSDSSPDSSHFFMTLTRVNFFLLWLGLGLKYRDSGRVRAESRPSPSSSGRAVLHFFYSINKWGREKYFVCFHVLEDKEIFNMWTTGLMTRTWNFFLTRTRIWQFELRHSTASDTISYRGRSLWLLSHLGVGD